MAMVQNTECFIVQRKCAEVQEELQWKPKRENKFTAPLSLS